MPPSPPADADGVLDRELIRGWPLRADGTDDKHGRGTVLIVGGSEQTPGAAILAGVAALRVGAGKLQLATDGRVALAMAVAVPEAGVSALDDEALLVERMGRADAVVVGPGVLDDGLAAHLLELALETVRDDAVLTVDAGAIKALPDRRRRSRVAGPVVITPNREELAELFERDVKTAARSDATAEPGELERRAATELDVSVVSFGCVAAPDGRCWLDASVVRGLGTSGAGDVLGGAVGGFGARTSDGPQAACWAALVHRLAAQRLAMTRAPVGYLARELADELSVTLAMLDPAGGAGS